MKASTSICGICALLGVAVAGQMVGTNNKEVEEEKMRVSRRTGDQVTVEGAKLNLVCETNMKWELCSWSTPGGHWCHTLGGEAGRRFCEEDQRIEFVTADDHACSVVVHGATVGDTGTWKCEVKEEIQEDHVAKEDILVTVATPYKLSIDRDDIGKDSNQTGEVGCVAEGGGGVELEMEWRVDGESRGERLRTDASTTRLVLELEGVSPVAVLRCLGRQTDPSTGRVLFESSVYSVLGLTEEPVVTQKVSSSTRFAGIAIGGVIGIVLLVTIIFFIVGHRNKCVFFNKRPTKDVGLDTSAPDGIEVEYGHKEGRVNNEYVRLVKVDKPEEMCEDCEIELKSKKVDCGSSVLRDAAEKLLKPSIQETDKNKINLKEGGKDKASRISCSDGSVAELQDKNQPIYAEINFDKKASKKWKKPSDDTATVYAVIKSKSDTEIVNNELRPNSNIGNDDIKSNSGSNVIYKPMNETNF